MIPADLVRLIVADLLLGASGEVDAALISQGIDPAHSGEVLEHVVRRVLETAEVHGYEITRARPVRKETMS